MLTDLHACLILPQYSSSSSIKIKYAALLIIKAIKLIAHREQLQSIQQHIFLSWDNSSYIVILPKRWICIKYLCKFRTYDIEWLEVKPSVRDLSPGAPVLMEEQFTRQSSLPKLLCFVIEQLMEALLIQRAFRRLPTSFLRRPGVLLKTQHEECHW